MTLTEKAIQEIYNRGYIPLDFKDLTYDGRILFKDQDGYKYNYSWGKFKHSTNFQIVSSFNPFSVENANLYLSKIHPNLKLISAEIPNVTSNLEFTCVHCGEPFLCTWNHLKHRKTFLCKKCFSLSPSIFRDRLPYEQIKDLFDSHELTLLTTEYQGADKLLPCKDKDGYKYTITYNNLKYGKTPLKFSQFNKFTIENIQLFLVKLPTNTTILSTEYINEDTPLLFKCGNCGEIFERKWSSRDKTNKFFCEKCGIVIRGINNRVSIEIVEEKFKEMGFILLDKNYIGNCHPLLCQNQLGYRGFIPYHHLERIKRDSKVGFAYFSIKSNKSNVIYNLNNFCRLNSINTQVIGLDDSGKYKRNGIKCVCECGEEFITTIASFTWGKTRCGICAKSISSLEHKVILWLNQNNIPYETQKKFDDCRNILPLPFDFYLPTIDTLIEIDGEGHYQPCYFNQCSLEHATISFEKTQHTDKIKTQYCIDHNLKLLRIPYWEFQNKNYKNILNKLINS